MLISPFAASRKWQTIECKGSVPPPRFGNFISFDGIGAFLLTLSLGHSATYISKKNSLIILGGGMTANRYENKLKRGQLMIEKSSKRFNEIWELDISSWSWQKYAPKFHPDGRAAHTAVYLEDRDSVLLFGGHGTHGKCFPDLWLLDIGRVEATHSEIVDTPHFLIFLTFFK